MKNTTEVSLSSLTVNTVENETFHLDLLYPKALLQGITSADNTAIYTLFFVIYTAIRVLRVTQGLKCQIKWINYCLLTLKLQFDLSLKALLYVNVYKLP